MTTLPRYTRSSRIRDWVFQAQICANGTKDENHKERCCVLRFCLELKQGELKNNNLDCGGISIGKRASDMLSLTTLQRIFPELIRRLSGTSIRRAVRRAVRRRGAGVARRICTRWQVTGGVRRTSGASHAHILHNVLVLCTRGDVARSICTRCQITGGVRRTSSTSHTRVTLNMLILRARDVETLCVTT